MLKVAPLATSLIAILPSASAQDFAIPAVKLTLVAPAPPAAQGTQPAANKRTGYLLSDQRLQDEPKTADDGFLTGLRGFDHFCEPIGQPIYFESPFITSSLRALYLHHTFNKDSQLGGGHLNVAALQARLALTERLAFIATKDGYSWLHAAGLPDENGWNSLAAGLKYTFVVDRQNDVVVTGGARYQIKSGERKVLQYGTDELSPFVSAAKGFDNVHIIVDATYRLPFDNANGNQIFQWDVHGDVDLSQAGLRGVVPVVEIHGLHYLTNGDALPLKIGGLDYANIGSADVAGSAVVWAGLGARFKLTPNASLGATYEFALTDPKDDIMDRRVMIDFILSW